LRPIGGDGAQWNIFLLRLSARASDRFAPLLHSVRRFLDRQRRDPTLQFWPYLRASPKSWIYAFCAGPGAVIIFAAIERVVRLAGLLQEWLLALLMIIALIAILLVASRGYDKTQRR
jgi:hypothetical protein